MGIVRTVEWRMAVPAEETWNRAFAAMTVLDLAPESDDNQTMRGASKRSFTKNRWAAEVSLTVKPVGDVSHVVCQVDMAGSKHFEIVDDIAEKIGEDAFDDADITGAIERIGGLRRFLGRKEVKHLRHLIRATESVLSLGQGVYNGRQGIVVLTDQRLFFLEKGIFRESLEEFSLSSISSLLVNKKPTGEALTIIASGNTAEITTMFHGHADALARAFREHKNRPAPAAAPAAAAPQPPDALEQLRKLGELRDAGVLTDAEFEAKKAVLLERL